jgi:hypothetical protein
MNHQMIHEQAKRTLEGVEYAISHSHTQVNKHLLPRIKEIVQEIAVGNFNHVSELKSICVSNTPEGSDPENDIFATFVQAENRSLNFGALLWDLAEAAMSE